MSDDTRATERTKRQLALDALPAALAALKTSAVALRAAAVDLQRTIGAANASRDVQSSDRRTVLDALLTPEAIRDVAAVALLLDQEHARHEAMAATIDRIVEARGAERAHSAAWQAGQVLTAISCPCGECSTCKARDAAQAENREVVAAVAAVAAVLAAQYHGDTCEAPALTNADGTPLRASPRIVIQ